MPEATTNTSDHAGAPPASGAPAAKPLAGADPSARSSAHLDRCPPNRRTFAPPPGTRDGVLAGANWRVQPPAVPVEKHALPHEQARHYPRLRSVAEHPTRWEFPAYLDNPSCAWLQSLKEIYQMPISFPASMSPAAGLQLHALVLNAQPRVVVEVGTFCSVSTHWIAGALAELGGERVIHCFDDFGPVRPGPWRKATMEEGRLDFVRERLSRAGLAHLARFHPGDSPTEITRARAELEREGGVDLAMIDGDHTAPGALQDLWAVEPVLKTGGLVILHDTFPDQCGDHQGPRYIVDYVNDVATGLYQAIDLYLAPLNYGMGVLRRIG
ncbi:MAG: class I SAM-dependent methyltransferase [Phycisphaerales bacterium]|jgi:predicted O-methyltransferase YrrM|nr:class I SAM-dependent methyltransferase [Phycisphaerales bacterium]